MSDFADVVVDIEAGKKRSIRHKSKNQNHGADVGWIEGDFRSWYGELHQ